MKRLLSLLALLLSAPVFAASDVTPVYPDLILQKSVTTVSTGSPQRTQPVAYQIVATGTGATVSATVKIYCKTINLHWAAGTQQGSDITLSASNTDVDTSVTVTSGCPYLYSDVTAISATTVEVVATPIYASAGASTNANAGQYADDADFADNTSVGVLSQGVAESASPTAVTEGDVGAAAITLNRAWKSSLYTPLGDSAMDDTANAVKVLNYVSENAATATDVDVDDAVGNIVVTIDTGAVAATRLSCTFLNEDEAANATIDEWYIFLNPAGKTSLTNVTAYTEADFASPSGQLLFVRTGAPSGEADATPDTTLDETDVLTVILDVGGIDNVVFEAGASADNADVTYHCTYN